jgi:RHS repeat-associated protein
LYQTVGGGVTTRFQYDGAAAIAEYNGSNVLQRRFVHGPGVDEPIVWYEGSGTSDRRWLHQDRLGSVIAISNGSGVATNINTYDEYGVPGSANAGRFQYTGQMWIPEAALYHYKARAYPPGLGRFLQTDPILYAGGMNRVLSSTIARLQENFTEERAISSWVKAQTDQSTALGGQAAFRRVLPDRRASPIPACSILLKPYTQLADTCAEGCCRGANASRSRAASGR